MNELRPCPFCGSEAHTYHNNLWHVSCDNPKGYCVMGFGAFLTEEEAVAAWNGRVKPVYAKVKLPRETQERIEQMVHEEVSKRLKELNIIRCKDCKYSHMTIDGKSNKWCSVLATHQIDSDEDVDPPNGYDPEPYFDADFFCGFAERKDA